MTPSRKLQETPKDDPEYDPSKDGYLSYYAAIEAKRARGDKHWPGSMLRYELPYPPTTNNLFTNAVKGRVKSLRYRKWLTVAGQNIMAQGRRRINGQVSLSIAVTKPDNRKRDLSNLIKAVEDMLVSMAVIEDDSLIQRISIQWDAGLQAECVVLVQKYEGGAA